MKRDAPDIKAAEKSATTRQIVLTSAVTCARTAAKQRVSFRRDRDRSQLIVQRRLVTIPRGSSIVVTVASRAPSPSKLKQLLEF